MANDRDETYWEQNYRDLEARILAQKPFRLKPESEHEKTYFVTPIVTLVEDITDVDRRLAEECHPVTDAESLAALFATVRLAERNRWFLKLIQIGS